MVKKTSLAAVAASVTTLVSASAFAQDAAGAAANKNDVSAMLAVAAGFAIGIAVLGGALGQGRAAASALEGISRNPGAAAKIQTPMILGLALIESLVLFAFLIAFLLMGKIQLFGPPRRAQRSRRRPNRRGRAPGAVPFGRALRRRPFAAVNRCAARRPTAAVGPSMAVQGPPTTVRRPPTNTGGRSPRR